MKTPPLLLFAAMLFWGWQSHLLWAGVLGGGVLELARVFPGRWDLEDVDFNRIWSLCVVVTVALAGYIFTTSDAGGGLAGMFGSGAAGVRKITDSSTVATMSIFRWLPLIFLPFAGAQVWNIRPSVPITAVSLVLRIRRRRGEQTLAGRYLDITYPFFILCLFSAGIHSNAGGYFTAYTYFFGEAALILWALWTLRTGRHGWVAWCAGLTVVLILGFAGQLSILGLERMLQNFDAQIIARWLRSRTDPFQSITSIGDIGELKLSPRIVIRLQPERVGVVPNYLREATYRTYQERGQQTWLAGSGGNDFPNVLPEPDNTTWLLLSNQVGTATINIACYLNGRSREYGDPQGALPLPSGTCRLLNLPYYTAIVALQTNRLGVTLATGSGLQIFDARYGPGGTIDSPPDASTNQMDLNVPTNEVPALNQVIAEMQLTNASSAAIRRTINAFFIRNFTYSTWQGADQRTKTNASPLTRFLLTTRSGHCEYFATATVLLLRELGIPARYAVGYYVHETSGAGYVVRERDAHAWCLVWNSESRRWEDFDTTPPSWVAVEGRNASFFDSLSDLRSWLGFQFERLRWRQANLRQYILWTLSPVIVVLLYYIVFKRRSKKRPAARMASEAPVVWPGHDSAFYRLEQALACRDLPRLPQEALSDWLERILTEPVLADLRTPIRELLRLHYRYRFDPFGLNAEEKELLVQNAGAVLQRLPRLAAK